MDAFRRSSGSSAPCPLNPSRRRVVQAVQTVALLAAFVVAVGATTVQAAFVPASATAADVTKTESVAMESSVAPQGIVHGAMQDIATSGTVRNWPWLRWYRRDIRPRFSFEQRLDVRRRGPRGRRSRLTVRTLYHYRVLNAGRRAARAVLVIDAIEAFRGREYLGRVDRIPRALRTIRVDVRRNGRVRFDRDLLLVGAPGIGFEIVALKSRRGRGKGYYGGPRGYPPGQVRAAGRVNVRRGLVIPQRGSRLLRRYADLVVPTPLVPRRPDRLYGDIRYGAPVGWNAEPASGGYYEPGYGPTVGVHVDVDWDWYRDRPNRPNRPTLYDPNVYVYETDPGGVDRRPDRRPRRDRDDRERYEREVRDRELRDRDVRIRDRDERVRERRARGTQGRESRDRDVRVGPPMLRQVQDRTPDASPSSRPPTSRQTSDRAPTWVQAEFEREEAEDIEVDDIRLTVDRSVRVRRLDDPARDNGRAEERRSGRGGERNSGR